MGKEKRVCIRCGLNECVRPIIKMPHDSVYNYKTVRYKDGGSDICITCLEEVLKGAHCIYKIPAHIG